LRDALALDRTRLANERTFLSYIRTSLAFFAAGAALLHFFPLTSTQVMGWMLLALGAVTILVGGWRFIDVRRRIRHMTAAHLQLESRLSRDD
jgi:putative membrane protein